MHPLHPTAVALKAAEQRITELEMSEASLALVIEHQDRMLKHYYDALVLIANATYEQSAMDLSDIAAYAISANTIYTIDKD